MRNRREIVRLGIAVALACLGAMASTAPTDERFPVQYWDLPTVRTAIEGISPGFRPSNRCGRYNACMPKSAFAAALDEVQQPMTALLRNIGFRRRGRTYNRTVADGVVHVVNFQMGQFPIGDYIIPGVRESYYGRFTVNLGVMLPAVSKLESGREPPVFVPEYYCEIRERLGSLVYGDDVWWDLDHQIAATGQSIVELMDRAGLPFLDQYESYSSVLSHLDEADTLPSSNAGRSALVGALICVATGERERAAKFFDRAAAAADRSAHKGFLGHVKDLRSSCGL